MYLSENTKGERFARVCLSIYLYIMYINGLNKNNRCTYIYYIQIIVFVRADTAYIYYNYRYLKSCVPADFLNVKNLLLYIIIIT